MDILTSEDLRDYGCGCGFDADVTGKLIRRGVTAEGQQRMTTEAAWVAEAASTGDTTLLLQRWRASVMSRITMGKKPHPLKIPLAISKAIGAKHQVHVVLAKDGTLTKAQKERGKPRSFGEVLLPACE